MREAERSHYRGSVSEVPLSGISNRAYFMITRRATAEEPVAETAAAGGSPFAER